MADRLESIRNIGISAHIDSGKTTLTERILFYTKRIHAIHEVKGKDGVGATMDSMELERERGITIQSAATYCIWRGCHINLIDTPGHVDFTIEVERALRVLDGGVLVLCAVAGVQSQSLTVDRQMRRYRVPRIAFINKCDRGGANPFRVVTEMREKLRDNAVMVQIPMGLEASHEGVIDLITMRAIRFEGKAGETLLELDIPDEYLDEAKRRREMLLDAASLCSDELTAAMLSDSVTPDLIHAALRRGTIDLKITPVFVGSAYKNKGVQLLLDGVARYLPSPAEVSAEAVDLSSPEGAKVALRVASDAPLVCLAFKLEDGPYGQLTYVRVYQGSLKKGDTIVNARTSRSVKVGRLVRLHADKMEDIVEAGAGEIVALFGIDCASGDTFTSEDLNIAMTPMHVPEPVISLRIKVKDRKQEAALAKALGRFTKEDPTFRVHTDAESSDTVISGMGELHLDVYSERIRREYKADVELGMPQVAYRERATRRADFNYLHRKQTGGAGQYGRVEGYLEPSESGVFEFENEIKGGSIPTEYIPAVEKGFRSMLGKGTLIGFPVAGLRVVITDGQAHDVDSSDHAFQAAARGAFRDAYPRARPVALEPIMKLVVEGPVDFHGAILRTVLSRRGLVIGTNEFEGYCRVEAEVPLATMFGYATELRSSTQGRAEFSMEFARYAPTPAELTETLIKEAAAKRAGKADE